MIYLDTHVIVWLYAGLTTRLRPAARDLLNTSDLSISPMVFLQDQDARLDTEVYGRIGQPIESWVAIAEALAQVDDTDERWWEAELYRLKGALLLMQDGPRPKWAEAEECFYQALTVARGQQAKSLALRAAMSLSRLWQRQGKRQAAYQLLADVYQWFTEGCDTADLKEARVLLAECV